MGTYYVDNDVGATGGTGTQQDPYGIETAIGAASAGDVFYWRGGGEGDVSCGHTLEFSAGGTDAAPVRWVGTDDDWVPVGANEPPLTGVDGNDGAYTIVRVSGMYQIFEGIRIHNSLQGRYGGVVGCEVASRGVLMRNVRAHDCGVGFSSSNKGHVFAHCEAHDVAFGFDTDSAVVECFGCTAYDAEYHAFRALAGMRIVGCRAHHVGGNGVEFYHDNALAKSPLTIERLSVHDCVHGVNINAYASSSANVFAVTNSLLSTCSGYAVNVTEPVGQLGVLLHNGSWNCSAGQVPAGRVGLISEGWVTLGSSPFIDAANGNLGLNRSTAARGAAADGGDLGAVQRGVERVGYPAIGLV
ncbi:MAG: hypothetical protein GY842_08670 [bacterium]|nr:hypothetical protein [bacterium]